MPGEGPGVGKATGLSQNRDFGLTWRQSAKMSKNKIYRMFSSHKNCNERQNKEKLLIPMAIVSFIIKH